LAAVNYLLYPAGILYGIIMWVRKLFFSFGILKSEVFNIPVISVGNLSAGGTGKTPHVEYLIRLLSETRQTATLSRGYGRRTRGFMIAREFHDHHDIGDEPMQYVRKFRDVVVAVDERRRRGIHKLMETHPELQMILLDDAYQHMYVKPGLSILLTAYHHLYTQDFVLPAGSLREFRSQACLADLIVVTKTPKIFSPITRRRLISELALQSHQEVYFSYIQYDEAIPLNPDFVNIMPERVNTILLFSGIADDYALREHLGRLCEAIEVIRFPDHHVYSPGDLKKIRNEFDRLPTKNKILVTTEKDAMRLRDKSLQEIFIDLPAFFIPIRVRFHEPDEERFNKRILYYVQKNSANL